MQPEITAPVEYPQNTVLSLFMAGKSKGQIGRELGIDKKRVARMLTQEIAARGRDCLPDSTAE